MRRCRKSALLALAEMPESERAGEALHGILGNKQDDDDRWITDATSIAACRHDAGFLKALFAAHPGAANSSPGATIAEAAPENLIPNPSFEELDARGMPKGWKVRNYVGKATHSIDSPGHISDHCLKIESTTGSDTSLFVDVPVEPFTGYALSAFIKTQGIKGATGALLNVHGTEHKTEAVTGTTDWKKVEITFNSGDAATVSINCLFGGWGPSTGTAWFDDVELTRAHPSAMPGKEGKVAAVVINQYARRGPVDSIIATLSAVRKSDPQLAATVVKGLSASWPENAAPKLTDADVNELREVMKSLPDNAKARLSGAGGSMESPRLVPRTIGSRGRFDACPACR